MTTVGVKNKRGSWARSEKGNGDSKEGRNEKPDTPLAAQLQQAWLQTQLPKRNVPTLDYLSPLLLNDLPVVRSSFSSQSHIPSQSRSQSVSPDLTDQSDSVTSNSEAASSGSPSRKEYVADSDPLEDPLLQFLSDMLMEEDLCEKKCMFVECSAYQAMTKELADLIGDPGASDESYGDLASKMSESVNSWVDDVLDSSPSDYFADEDVEASAELRDLEHCVPRAPLMSGKEVFPGILEYSECKEGSSSDAPKFVQRRNSWESGIESLEEFRPLIMQCAQAVAADDVGEAHQLINKLREKSSPDGDGGQRMAHYFTEALVARLSGTGGRLYTVLSSNKPNAVEMVKAYRLFIQCNPLPKLAHYFANQTILSAVRGAKRIHIIDFGILLGVQWPCFIHALSQRAEGAPHLRITGVDFAQPGFRATSRLEETGRRLTDKAKLFGVDFEYHAIAGKWELIQPSQFNIRQDEVLIVNSMFRLRNMLDETVMPSSPRKLLLSKIHSLNPALFVTGVVSAGLNTPFFMARVRESISHYSALFDAIDSSVPPHTELRLIAEREILGREILNVLACEGVERIERAETYKQWQSRIANAGFKQEPLDPELIQKTQNLSSPFHEGFGFSQDGKWLISGWKGRTLHGLSSWKP